jgi:hypothetical protein
MNGQSFSMGGGSDSGFGGKMRDVQLWPSPPADLRVLEYQQQAPFRRLILAPTYELAPAIREMHVSNLRRPS